MNEKDIKGSQGEETACKYLSRQGMSVIKRRYRLACGEIDIIAEDGKTLVFVEVKYRKNDSFGGAVCAVGSAKQKRMVSTALSYIKETGKRPDSIRFDVVAVTGESTEHIPNAFTPERFSY